MDSIRKWIRKKKTSTLLIIFLLGACIVFATGWRIALSGVGTSLMASAVLSFLMMAFLGDEDDYMPAKEWGLERIYNTRGEMNSSSAKHLDKAKALRAIAFGFKSLRDSKEARVIQMLREGRTIRLITMKPDCSILKERERDEQQEIKSSIENLIAWAKKLNNSGYPGKIEIRYHDHLPSYFVFIMNNRLFTGPYEFKKASQQTISFEYNTFGEAYEYYNKYFERLWDDPEFCEDALKDH